jgi:Rrf2 family protein
MPVQIKDISKRQQIPQRYLEQIFHKLKGAKIVKSVRGPGGGYLLARPPEKITVGEIFRFLVGSSDPAQCVACVSKKDCPFDGRCAFAAMWEKVTSAINSIYNETTIKDLLENEDGIRKSHIET